MNIKTIFKEIFNQMTLTKIGNQSPRDKCTRSFSPDLECSRNENRNSKLRFAKVCNRKYIIATQLFPSLLNNCPPPPPNTLITIRIRQRDLIDTIKIICRD